MKHIISGGFGFNNKAIHKNPINKAFTEVRGGKYYPRCDYITHYPHELLYRWLAWLFFHSLISPLREMTCFLVGQDLIMKSI